MKDMYRTYKANTIGIRKFNSEYKGRVTWYKGNGIETRLERDQPGWQGAGPKHCRLAATLNPLIKERCHPSTLHAQSMLACFG